MIALVSPTFLKQEAKKLKRNQGLTMSEALDETSKTFGFSNYRHYLNVLESNHKQSKSDKEVLLKNILLEKEMAKKIHLAISFIQNFKISFHEQLDLLKMFQHSDDMQAVCEKLNLMKDEIQSYLLKDFLTDEGKDEIHFIHPYFIAKEISLSDLTYEINEDMLHVDGHYDIKTKFDFKNPLFENKEDRKDERFNDRELFGSFEITVDSHKKITMVHSDIGEKFDGFFQVASFR